MACQSDTGTPLSQAIIEQLVEDHNPITLSSSLARILFGLWQNALLRVLRQGRRERSLESWYCSLACQRKHWKAGHKHKCVKADKAEAAHAVAAPPAVSAATQSGGGASAAAGGGARAVAGGEECAICLDALQQPQTMPCGHRFCRGCVASMRRHGAAVAQVCPLCRGAMPDAERLQMEALRLFAQYERQPGGAALSAAVQEEEDTNAICYELL